MMLIAGVTSFYYFSGDFMEKLVKRSAFIWVSCTVPCFTNWISSLWYSIFAGECSIFWLPFSDFVLTAIISNVSQVGLMFTGKALAPKFSKYESNYRNPTFIRDAGSGRAAEGNR